MDPVPNQNLPSWLGSHSQLREAASASRALHCKPEVHTLAAVKIACTIFVGKPETNLPS